MKGLVFRTIDLNRDADTCLRFRADSYRVSFGSDTRFWDENGQQGEGYLTWLAERIAELPEGCVHLWEKERIVGQLEARIRSETPPSGYINLYYLAPEARGRGLGSVLDDYIVNVFVQQQINVIRLSVSPKNQAAFGFYLHRHWNDLGLRPGRTDVHLMEKYL